MQRVADFSLFEQRPKPLDVIRGLKKRMIAVNRRVLSLNNVLNLAERLGGGIPDPLDMLRDKQQVIWIDVTGLNEALGLLCAAAGVVLIHQAALAVHELVEVVAGLRG